MNSTMKKDQINKLGVFFWKNQPSVFEEREQNFSFM